MLVLGGGIHGEQVLAQWPGLSVADLDNGDLAITTDYHDVLGEVLRQRLGIPPTMIFPQHVFAPVGVA